MSAAAQPGSDARPALGAVLAGGAGSRLGRAKATAELGGRPLIAYPLAALEQAGLEAVVVAKRDSALPDVDVELVPEPDAPRHPLCGIVAALRHGGGRPLVVVGCDMPFVAPGLLERLAAAPEPLALASVDGEAQPLLARYDASLLPALEAALERREALRRTVDSLGPRLLDEEEIARFGEPRRICFNVNTQADLEQAERMREAPSGQAPG